MFIQPSKLPARALAAMAALSWYTALYDLELTWPSGDRSTPFEGNITLQEEITR